MPNASSREGQVLKRGKQFHYIAAGRSCLGRRLGERTLHSGVVYSSVNTGRRKPNRDAKFILERCLGIREKTVESGELRAHCTQAEL